MLMTKIEFLSILRQSLEGEVDPNEIEQNIRYYDQYIGIRPVDEEEIILNKLGDPRLIAKTIIEADKAAKQRKNINQGESHHYSYYKAQNQETEDLRSKQSVGLKWYHKIAVAIAVLFIIIIISILGSIMFRILFTIGFPIILILLLLILFRKR